MFWFKRKPKPLWFDGYHSAQELTTDQRIFMSYYTEEGFQAILGEMYSVSGRHKVYLSEYMKAIQHFINTGEKKYFYDHGQLNGVASYGQWITGENK